MTALADTGAGVAAEIDQLTARASGLYAELHEELGSPDQADWSDAMRAALTARRGVGVLTRVTALTSELTVLQRQMAEAQRRRELHAETVAKEQRLRAREHAAELLPEHRAIAGRMAEAAEALLAAAEAEAELHAVLRRRFDHVPLRRLALIDLRGLRAVAKAARAYSIERAEQAAV